MDRKRGKRFNFGKNIERGMVITMKKIIFSGLIVSCLLSRCFCLRRKIGIPITLILIIMISGLVVSCQVWGAVPQKISVQGKIVGSTIEDGSKTATIRLSKTLGSAPLKTAYANVPVSFKNNIFNATLTLEPAFIFDNPTNLSLTVNSVTYPVIDFTSVPYALNSDKLDGLSVTSFVTKDAATGNVVGVFPYVKKSGDSMRGALSISSEAQDYDENALQVKSKWGTAILGGNPLGTYGALAGSDTSQSVSYAVRGSAESGVYSGFFTGGKGVRIVGSLDVTGTINGQPAGAASGDFVKKSGDIMSGALQVNASKMALLAVSTYETKTNPIGSAGLPNGSLGAFGSGLAAISAYSIKNYGIYARTGTAGKAAVYGENLALAGLGIVGIYGKALNGDGVAGEGLARGVWGSASSGSGRGVSGYAGTGIGVYGQSDSSFNPGLYAKNISGGPAIVADGRIVGSGAMPVTGVDLALPLTTNWASDALSLGSEKSGWDVLINDDLVVRDALSVGGKAFFKGEVEFSNSTSGTSLNVGDGGLKINGNYIEVNPPYEYASSGIWGVPVVNRKTSGLIYNKGQGKWIELIFPPGVITNNCFIIATLQNPPNGVSSQTTVSDVNPSGNSFRVYVAQGWKVGFVILYY